MANSTPSGGGDSDEENRSEEQKCFYWDLLLRIILNSVLAVLGIIGNR